MRISKKFALVMLGTTMLAAPAFAQAVAENSGLENIVVTARKRAEPLQSVPVAVSAVDSNRLQETHVTTLADLSQLVPSLNLARNVTNPTSMFPFLRGFGSKSSDPASEPTVTISIDGVALAQVIGSYLPSFDMETISVERGPQGTLEGRNAPAGLVSIRTRRPGDKFAAFAQFDYASFNDIELRTYVDVPIVQDKLLATVSYFRQTSDGYEHNLNAGGKTMGDINTNTARVAFLAKPSDNFSWYLTGSYLSDEGTDPSVRPQNNFTPLRVPGAAYVVSTPPVTLTCTRAYSAGLCTPGNQQAFDTQRYTTYGQVLPPRHSHGFNVTSELTADAGAVNFTSVTGYRIFNERAYQDIDGTPLDILTAHFIGDYRQASEEFRVASSKDGGLDMGGRLNWLIGFYYSWFDFTRLNAQKSLGGFAYTYEDGSTNSLATFAHAEYKITDNIDISGGIRETWDRKTHDALSTRGFLGLDPTTVQRHSWQNTSYDVTLDYKFTPDQMVYLRYATGYRGGAFTGVPSTVAAIATVNPETVKAYEIGAKADFFEHRARINVSGFWNDYSNLQRVISSPIAAPPFFVQAAKNIASARTKGVEVEASAKPMPELTLRANVGYLDAKYTSFVANLTGNLNDGVTNNIGLAFPYTSKWTMDLGLTYDVPLGERAGGVSVTADYAYRSHLNYTDLNYPFASQNGYGLLNASIAWHDPSGHYTVTLYGKNLTNKFYLDGGDAVGGLNTYVSDGPPRQLGVSVAAKF